MEGVAGNADMVLANFVEHAYPRMSDILRALFDMHCVTPGRELKRAVKRLEDFSTVTTHAATRQRTTRATTAATSTALLLQSKAQSHDSSDP